jgi:hypothetical protein
MPNGKQPNPNENIDLYREWTNAVIATARLLIPYQRPTYFDELARRSRRHQFGIVAPVGRNGVEELLGVVALASTTMLVQIASPTSINADVFAGGSTVTR